MMPARNPSPVSAVRKSRHGPGLAREPIQEDGDLQVEPVPHGQGASEKDLPGVEPAGGLLGPGNRDLQDVAEHDLRRHQDEHHREGDQGRDLDELPDETDKCVHGRQCSLAR